MRAFILMAHSPLLLRCNLPSLTKIIDKGGRQHRKHNMVFSGQCSIFAGTEGGNCLVVYFCYTDGFSNLINCIDIDVSSPFSPVNI